MSLERGANLLTAQHPVSDRVLLFPVPRSVDVATGRCTVGTGPIGVELVGFDDDVDIERLAAHLGRPVAPRGSQSGLVVRIGLLPSGIKIPTTLTDAQRRSAYLLDVRADHVTIAADSLSGVYLAARTLAQLLNQYAVNEEPGIASLPCVAIVDWPEFVTRGVMLDVSRDRIPTMPEFFSIIETLASIKINHLQLYTEHTFAYAAHPAVWRGWSPITPEEVRQLDTHCRLYGIELVANQNCFGHLAHWLRMSEYAHLAETQGDWMFDVWPRSGPFSLCPTDPRSIEFVDGLLDELMPCFGSRLVNIGADETYDIAYGRSKDEVAKRGRAAVYLDFVQQICDRVKARGGRPMFWADIALHEPRCIPDIPSDLISLAWGYEPDSPFEKWVADLNKAGREVWVCPGTSSWRSITGRTGEARDNMLAAASAGAGGKSAGYLLCDWGDTGHHQQWPVTLNAIGLGAAISWGGGMEAYDSKAASLALFGDQSLSLCDGLLALGDADALLRAKAGRLSRPKQDGEFALWNQSAMFADMHNCPLDDRTEVGAVADWQSARDRLARAGGQFLPVSPLVDAELKHTLAVADFALRRAIARRAAGGLALAEKASLATDLRAIMAEHARLWALRSRPGGLDHSLSFYQKVLDQLAV